MEFLGHQIEGDVITLSEDNLEKMTKTPRPTTKKAIENLPRISGLLQRPHPRLRRDVSTALPPPQERKVRTSTIE